MITHPKIIIVPPINAMEEYLNTELGTLFLRLAIKFFAEPKAPYRTDKEPIVNIIINVVIMVKYNQ